MKKQSEKLLADLHRLIDAQNFSTEAELRAFIDSIAGQPIPSFPQEALTVKEMAQDLVFSAYDMKPAKAKATIEQALQLDPDCIEAYEYLGSMESTPEIATVFYEKGIAIGKQLFGGKYLEEHKGHFWGFHETRPYMRCLQQHAECLYDMGKVKECVAILEEMIELNPNDNQGVRDQLMLYLIQLGENKKFLKYAKMYKDDWMAFSLFNRALYAFTTEGETDKAIQQLKKAIQQNKFVAQRILSNKPITTLPNSYSPGDESEAAYYALYAQEIWSEVKGAREWLRKHSAK